MMDRIKERISNVECRISKIDVIKLETENWKLKTQKSVSDRATLNVKLNK